MVLGLKPMGKPSTEETLQVLDRTKALYGPRTQAYGETKYRRKITSFGQNQGLVWSSDSSLWGNQVHKKHFKFWTEPRPCMVLGLKPIGKPSTYKKNLKFWTEPRPSMVLGLKPMAKPTTEEKLQGLDRTKALHGPRTQAYGESKYLNEKLQVLDRTKALYGSRTQANGETKYRRKKTSFGQNQGLVWSSDSSLWGNKAQKKHYKFWTEPRPCMVLGLKPMGKPST